MFHEVRLFCSRVTGIIDPSGNPPELGNFMNLLHVERAKALSEARRQIGELSTPARPSVVAAGA